MVQKVHYSVPTLWLVSIPSLHTCVILVHRMHRLRLTGGINIPWAITVQASHLDLSVQLVLTVNSLIHMHIQPKPLKLMAGGKHGVWNCLTHYSTYMFERWHYS